MNTSTSKPSMQSPKTLRRIFFVVSYNLINVLALLLCYHLVGIIRGDGPNGFGEVIIKGFIFLLSIASFLTGVILSVGQYRATKLHVAYIIACILITTLLIYFAAWGVIEACDDSKGYCRNWQIAVVAPNKSIQR